MGGMSKTSRRRSPASRPAAPGCPCGRPAPYAACCGPLHTGTAQAGTAERLMRSRFSAFAVGDAAYLLRSWHPDTRPPTLDLEPDVRWLRLEILDAAGGGPLDTEGTVEFRAHFRQGGGPAGRMHEVSRFRRTDGAWTYLDGAVSAD